MDEKNFIRQLEAHQRELNRLIHRRLPVLIGRMAKDHFQNNFRLQGFLNNGLKPWQETRRQQSGGKSAASQYGPLLSRRNHLFASIKYTPGDARVSIANDVLYAPIHNWGGSTHPTVTDKMRRFAWAMFYKEAGNGKDTSVQKQKRKACSGTFLQPLPYNAHCQNLLHLKETLFCPDRLIIQKFYIHLQKSISASPPRHMTDEDGPFPHGIETQPLYIKRIWNKY